MCVTRVTFEGGTEQGRKGMIEKLGVSSGISRYLIFGPLIRSFVHVRSEPVCFENQRKVDRQICVAPRELGSGSWLGLLLTIVLG